VPTGADRVKPACRHTAWSDDKWLLDVRSWCQLRLLVRLEGRSCSCKST